MSRLLVFLALLPVPMWSQLTVSTLRGTATDPVGAVIVNAHINAVNQETNLTREVVTNGSGDYEIVDLLRGSYRLLRLRSFEYQHRGRAAGSHRQRQSAVGPAHAGTLVRCLGIHDARPLRQRRA